MMRVGITLHGMFRIGVGDPDGRIALTLPDGASVAQALGTLREDFPAIDPWACLVMIGGAKIGLDHLLEDGQEVHVYPVFSGG